MANKGYTNIDNVTLYLARTDDVTEAFTDDQAAQVDILIGATEVYIDKQTRRSSSASWLNPPQSLEYHPLPTTTLYLKQRPVASVSRIQVRMATVGDQLRTLDPVHDYELIDPAIGMVLIQPGNQGAKVIAYVDYVPDQPIPADLALAATKIVAHSMGMTLFPDRWGVSSIQVDSRTHLMYDKDGIGLAIPTEAQNTIVSYRRTILT